MIDHLGLRVRDVQASKRFYESALKPLGYRLLHEYEGMLGFGSENEADLWISQGEPTRVHLAFRSPDRATVEAFHAAALDAGGRDNGPPGLRPHYHASYYGAFILDADGNNIEAVCHAS